MKRIGVDTNVVVSFLTDRDVEQQSRAARLIAGATAGEHIVVLHQSVITESVYVMCNSYGAKAFEVSATMRHLLSLPGIVVVDAMDWAPLWHLWPRRVKDFADACLILVAGAAAFDVLATFDRTLARKARRHGVATHW